MWEIGIVELHAAKKLDLDLDRSTPPAVTSTEIREPIEGNFADRRELLRLGARRATLDS